MSQHMIDEIDSAILQLKETRELGQMIEQLKKTPAFKQVVLQGYFRDEAVRLVHLRGDVAMQDPKQQEDVIRQIDAIAAFKTFLDTKLMMADRANEAIEECEANRQEILAGELS